MGKGGGPAWRCAHTIVTLAAPHLGIWNPPFRESRRSPDRIKRCEYTCTRRRRDREKAKRRRTINEVLGWWLEGSYFLMISSHLNSTLHLTWMWTPLPREVPHCLDVLYMILEEICRRRPLLPVNPPFCLCLDVDVPNSKSVAEFRSPRTYTRTHYPLLGHQSVRISPRFNGARFSQAIVTIRWMPVESVGRYCMRKYCRICDDAGE